MYIILFPSPCGSLTVLPRDAMLKRGLRRHAVSVCLSVCVSTFVDCVKTSNHIIRRFSLSGSHPILVFSYQTGWRYPGRNPLKGASNAGGVGRNRDFEPAFNACC